MRLRHPLDLERQQPDDLALLGGPTINDHHDDHDDLNVNHINHAARYHVDVYDYDFHLGRLNNPAWHVDVAPNHDHCTDHDCRRQHVHVVTDDYYRAVNNYIAFCVDGAVPIYDPRSDPAEYNRRYNHGPDDDPDEDPGDRQ